MSAEQKLREILWRGDSRKVAHGFPKGTRLKLGKELTRVQIGLPPRDGKRLSSVGQGVQEIRVSYNKNAFRVIYVAVFIEAVYVLHAFQKKAKTGIETPKEELDVAERRYRDLARERKAL